MDLSKDIEPVTALKTRTAELIHRVTETRNPIVITLNGRSAAVLQDVESWQRQRSTLLLLKAFVEGDEDYQKGRVVTHEEARSRLERKLGELREGA